MTWGVVVAGLGSVALAAAHVLAGRLRFVHGRPRARALSALGGVSVAYVFAQLLPEIERGQRAIAEDATGLVAALERHAYLLALVGLVVFYGAEQLAQRSRRQERTDDRTTLAFFRVHLGLFAAYSALIGYLVVRQVEELGVAEGLLFVVALAAHAVVNDTVLREHHADRFHDRGRWLLGGAVLVGWLVGAVVEVSPAAEGVLLAVLGGGIILNVLKEELPPEHESPFWSFAAGAALYSLVLVAV